MRWDESGDYYRDFFFFLNEKWDFKKLDFLKCSFKS